MFVIFFILMLFALVGIIYPTPLHKKIKFKQIDLGKRLWNVILFILCLILLSIFAPNQSQPAEDTDKKVKVETDKTNKQPKQPSTDQQNNEQDADEKAKAQEEQSKKNADEATKDDEEKSSESQKSQTTTEPSKPTPNETDESSNIYYANCKEARAAGAAPLYKGEPGYASKLDRDGDGVACE